MGMILGAFHGQGQESFRSKYIKPFATFRKSCDAPGVINPMSRMQNAVSIVDTRLQALGPIRLLWRRVLPA